MVEDYDVIRATEDDGGLETRSSSMMTSELSAEEVEANLAKDLAGEVFKRYRTGHNFEVANNTSVGVLRRAIVVFCQVYNRRARLDWDGHESVWIVTW